MAGFGLDVNFVLQQASFVLLQKVLNTVLPGGFGSGAQTVAIVDPSLYVGAQIIVGNPGANNQEVVTVTAITAVNFTATFANAHNANETVRGATFPAGQVSQSALVGMSSGAAAVPLFSQAEMLGYLRDVQNDMLERIRPVYASTTQDLKANIQIYSSPVDSIRVDRVAVNGGALWPASQADIDMDVASFNVGTPQVWFQDKLATSKYALSPTPQVGQPGGIGIYYSQKGVTLPAFTDSLIVPDMFWYGLKYGILAVAYAKDGEMRDARRAALCGKRYERVIAYGKKFMRSVQVEADFSRLAKAGVA